MRKAVWGLCLVAATARADAPANPTLLTAISDPSPTLAVDDTSVYWLTAVNETGGSSLRKTPKLGGASVELVKGQNTSYALVLAGGDLFFTNRGTSHIDPGRSGQRPQPSFVDGEVKRVPARGGKLQRIAARQHQPMAIAADAANVYWIDVASEAGDATLMKAPRAGGKAVVLAGKLQRPERVAADGGFVYFTRYSTQKPDDGTLNPDGALLRVPVKGGKPTVVATGLRGAQAIAFDATSIYLTDRYSVVSLPRAGGPLTVLAADQDEPTALALDDGHVYFTTFMGATVMKVAKTGGKPVILASGREGASGLAVDATRVFFADSDGIHSLPK